jgi:hypothetical protein
VTLDQALLTGLVIATVAAVAATWLVHRTQAKWRQKDLLRDFIRTWVAEVVVPTEMDAVRFKEDHLSYGIPLRPQVERDSYFTPTWKLVSKRIRHQYERFIKARSAYIETCYELYQQIEHDCTERTRFPVGRWKEEKDWPKRVLLPNFVLSIYEQVLGNKRDTFRLENISYNIGLFSHSGQGFERKGLHLTTSYDAYNGFELARAYSGLEPTQADDQAALERIKSIHRQMMEIEYGKKSVAQIGKVRELRTQADRLAHQVRDNLRKVQIS